MSIFLNKLPWSTILIFSQSVSSNAIFLNLLETWRQRPKSLNFKNLNKLSNVSSGKVSIGEDIFVVKFDELEFMKKRFSFVLLTYFWLERLDKSRIKLTIVRGKSCQSFKLLRFPTSKFSIDSGVEIPLKTAAVFWRVFVFRAIFQSFQNFWITQPFGLAGTKCWHGKPSCRLGIYFSVTKLTFMNNYSTIWLFLKFLDPFLFSLSEKSCLSASPR